MMLIKIFELDKVDPRVYMIIVLVITTLIVRVIADAWIKDINKLMTPAAQLIGNIVGMKQYLGMFSFNSNCVRLIDVLYR